MVELTTLLSFDLGPPMVGREAIAAAAENGRDGWPSPEATGSGKVFLYSSCNTFSLDSSAWSTFSRSSVFSPYTPSAFCG